MSCHYPDDEVQQMLQDRDDELEYAYLWQLDMHEKDSANFKTKPKETSNGTSRESN